MISNTNCRPFNNELGAHASDECSRHETATNKFPHCNGEPLTTVGKKTAGVHTPGLGQVLCKCSWVNSKFLCKYIAYFLNVLGYKSKSVQKYLGTSTSTFN